MKEPGANSLLAVTIGPRAFGLDESCPSTHGRRVGRLRCASCRVRRSVAGLTPLPTIGEANHDSVPGRTTPGDPTDRRGTRPRTLNAPLIALDWEMRAPRPSI